MEISTTYTLIITLVTTSLLAILVKLYSSFKYFSKQNIPYEKPKGLFGSGSSSQSMPLLLWDMYKKGGKNKFYGFFVLWSPSLLIKDTELIKQILVKNFSSFYDRGFYHDEERDPLTGHLFALEGETWKKLRAKLSPAFTSGKMKLMFPTIMNFGKTLVNYVGNKPEAEPLECFHLVAKYTLSNIASVAFGIESDLFNEESKFMEMALKFNAPSLAQLIRIFMLTNLQNVTKFLCLTVTPSDVASFFLQLSKDAVSYRENNNITRKDFLQTLIQLKNEGSIDGSSDKELLTMNRLSAQAFVFIIAGFETSALAQSWALYLLALHPECQQRLQTEVDTLDSWTYENIMELEYMEMVISETLRLYPTVPFIMRKCNEEFRLAGSDIVIAKGTNVSVSVFGLHHDPALFPDPETFDPERFGPKAQHEIQPYSYVPFGEGPRFCIGMRFAKMQVKVGLAMIMKNYTVEVSEKTPVPAELHPQTTLPTAKHGLWLRFKRRNAQ